MVASADNIFKLPCRESDVTALRYLTLLMTREEANQCLKDFFCAVAEAIKGLHTSGLAHMDIRLENICFDQDYKPVFIDLDRSEVAYQPVMRNKDINSCMIDQFKSTDQNDWVQLGWLVVWVIHRVALSYHSRAVTDMPTYLQKNRVIKALINDGHLVDDAEQNELFSGCEHTILYVLGRR